MNMEYVKENYRAVYDTLDTEELRKLYLEVSQVEATKIDDPEYYENAKKIVAYSRTYFAYPDPEIERSEDEIDHQLKLTSIVSA